MALTPIQRNVCRLLAGQRIASGESLFHDTREALAATWASDQSTLEREGYAIEIVGERPSFVEAVIRRDEESVVLQWTHDSAFRFFPLVEHRDLGLTMHPFDLATNKVLALVGRVEARDWIDIIHCDANIQPLGRLAWAASGKDPGLSPTAILEHAGRSTRYSASEVEALDFEHEPPDVASLSRRWHEILRAAAHVPEILPVEHIGECVLADDDLFRGGVDELRSALQGGAIHFHPGSIRGAFPRVAG